MTLISKPTTKDLNEIHIHNDIKHRTCQILNQKKHQTTNDQSVQLIRLYMLNEIQHLISTTVINIHVKLISTGSEIRKLNGQRFTTPLPPDLQ
jgi:hypothetical protein